MAIEQCLKTDDSVLDFGLLGDGGGSYTREITIKNDCEHEISVSGAFAAKVNGSPITEHSAASWLTFVGGEDKFTLGAKSSKVLQVRGYVPATAAGSSYYAELDLQNDSSDQHDAEYGDRLAIPVRMDVVKSEANVAGRLECNKVQFLDFDGTINAEAKVASDGDYGFLANYKLEKSPAFGLEDYVTIAEKSCEATAGDGCVLNAEREEANAGHYGVYKIRQTVSYVNGDGQKVESVLVQTVMNLPGVSLFIAGGVLFALIMLFLVSKAIKYSRRDKEEDKERKAREISPEEEDVEEEERLEKSARGAAAGDDSIDLDEDSDNNAGLSKRDLARAEREKAKEKKLREKEEKLRAKERAKAEKNRKR